MLRTSGVVEDAILSIIGPANTTHAGPVAVPRWAGGTQALQIEEGRGGARPQKYFGLEPPVCRTSPFTQSDSPGTAPKQSRSLIVSDIWGPIYKISYDSDLQRARSSLGNIVS